MNVISEIQKVFIDESINSPMLLSDLANMETYIAESYHSRSIIELLQNADDAKAEKFYILSNNNYIIVANNGRVFDKNDIMSICRSGASTKKRNKKTIGYRGIGFKSVINLAERVHILSGDFKLSFSKELTNTLIKTKLNVPLIRIPHNYTPILDYGDIIESLMSSGYNTIFIFENCKHNNLNEELNEFDSSSILFLNNIREVKIEANIFNTIRVIRNKSESGEIITIKDKINEERWLVIKDKSINSIAFLLNEDEEIIGVNNDRAVFHSFMSTKDEVGVSIKINGDFSTDPSRTKIVYDDISKNTLTECSKLLIEVIMNYLKDNNTYKYVGLFNILNKFKKSNINKFTSNVKIKDYLFENIESSLKTSEWFNGVSGINICRKPNWLNSDDFIEFCDELNLVPIDIEIEKSYPGILEFVDKFNMKSLEVEEVLKIIEKKEPSVKGCVDIIDAFIKKYRFACDNNIKKYIQNSSLICFENRDKSLKFNDEFYSYLKGKLNDINDFKWFVSKAFGELSIKIFEENELISKEKYKVNEEKQVLKKCNTIKTFPVINKWRSVEINLASFLRADKSVKEVIDVSKSNLGYDIEVHYKNDEVKYIEIKSVNQMGASVSLTNNEYSTANELKNQYLIAIVKQTECGIDVCYIENPVENMNLIKRVTRWEWICDEYNGKYLNYLFQE